MEKIKLYLDMDGVLADFHKAYYAGRIRDGSWDKTRFRDMVMQYQIFEDLDPMPNARELLDFTAGFKHTHDIEIEILTSVGTFDEVQGKEAKRQKLEWLRKQGITYKANFVRTKHEKAQYANSKTILIDDSHGCVKPFTIAGGHGILHEDAVHKETLLTFQSIVRSICALDVVRYTI